MQPDATYPYHAFILYAYTCADSCIDKSVLLVPDVAQPKTPIWKTEEIATVGELLLDISINLAKT
jgi:hypothetical protein